MSMCRVNSCVVGRGCLQPKCPLKHDWLKKMKGFSGGTSGKKSTCQCRRRKMWTGSLGREDPLEEGIEIHSSVVAWRIPKTEEPGRLWSIGSQRVGHDWNDSAHSIYNCVCMCVYIHVSTYTHTHMHTHTHTHRLSWWLSGKQFTYQYRRCRFDPWGGKSPWKRKWQPNPVFFPGTSQGQRSLVFYNPWGCKRIGHGLATRQLNSSNTERERDMHITQ